MKKNRDALYKARHIRDLLQRWKFGGLNRKLQMKPRKWIEEETPDGDTITRYQYIDERRTTGRSRYIRKKSHLCSRRKVQ